MAAPRKEHCLRGHARDRYSDGRCKACAREQYQANRREVIRRGQERRYGISQTAIEDLMSIGRCEICGNTPIDDQPSTRLCIDHDHRSMTIRGVLCNSCNRGLGYFRDNPDMLRKAADYLG